MRVSGAIATIIAIILSAVAFSPSAFSSVQPMPSIRNASYFINGTVYLYDGTYAGGYNPLTATSGAPVTVRWFDSDTGTYRTISTTTNAVGFFSVSIYNCTDGGLVELKARFVSPYLNWGYNYTYVDFIGHPGGRIQNIVCGVPYEVKITIPLPGAMEMPCIPFPATYKLYDRDGGIAQGYFTFSDGPMEWSSSDALFLPPAAKTFNGVSTGGSCSNILTLFTGGYQWLNISEGGSDEFNPYLTPWGNFVQIITGVTSPGFKDDWNNITLIVESGGGFDWKIVEGWNLVSCPMSTYETGSNGHFDAYDALKICHWQLFGFTELSLLKRLGGNPSSYETFDYGMPESSAFALDGVHSYWVYCDVSIPDICHFNGTVWPAGGNVLTLSAGWNMVGFTHNDSWSTTPTAKMFTDGTIDPDLLMSDKVIASRWDYGAQNWISYVASAQFPGMASKNWQWDFSYSPMPGNGLMLWVECPMVITFNQNFDSVPLNEICGAAPPPSEPAAEPSQPNIPAPMEIPMHEVRAGPWPIVGPITVTPNPHSGDTTSEQVIIQTTLDSSAIMAYIIAGQCRIDGASYAMYAQDGAFDEMTETVIYTYQFPNGFAEGVHIVEVRGEDTDGWGEWASDDFTVTDITDPTVAWLSTPPATLFTTQPANFIVGYEDFTAYDPSIANSYIEWRVNNGTWGRYPWINSSFFWGSYQNILTYSIPGGTFVIGDYVEYRGVVSDTAATPNVAYLAEGSFEIPNCYSQATGDPYPVYGYVYLYNGISGYYFPFTSSGGSIVTATWTSWYSGETINIMTGTNSLGQYSVDLMEYLNGDTIQLEAQFDAPYNNKGYNYTTVDLVGEPGSAFQEIVCGVPYEVKITNPLPGALEMPGVPFPVTYRIYDRDGLTAQGYYSFAGGPMIWYSCDPLFIPPASRIFNGVSNGGSATDLLTLFTGGYQWLNISEGGSSEFNPYLTPWGNFNQIINGETSPGWKDDWDNITLIVVGGFFNWNVVEGWNLVSVPQNPVNKGTNGIFDAYDALEYCHWQLPGVTQLSIADRTGGNPSTWNVFDYGMPEAAAFPMNGVHGYVIYSDVAGICSFNATNYSSTQALNLQAGWNLVGFQHNYIYWTTNPTASMFADGTVHPNLLAADKVIASQWDYNTQSWNSYVDSFYFPGLPTHNWAWDNSYSAQPGNALFLWVDVPLTITFNENFDAPINNSINGQPSGPVGSEGFSPENPGPLDWNSASPGEDPYPMYGYVKWADGSLVGPGAQVYIEWQNTSGPWSSPVIHDQRAGMFPVITNALGQYSIDMMQYDQDSIIWGNATINGTWGYNMTYPNFPFDGGKLFNITLETPSLTVTKSGPATANPGETIVYTIEATNTGNSTAYNLNITETYPSETTFVSSTPLPTFGDNVWCIPMLTAGASILIYITVAVSPTASGTLLNYVELTYEDSGGTPQPPVSDICSTVIVNPYMVISKTGPATANPGESITYTISYTNIGTDIAYNVVVTDTLPFGVIYVSAVPAPTSVVGQVLTWNIGTVAAGASGMIQIQVTVQINVPIGLLVMNYVELTYDDSGGEPQPAVNATCTTIIINPLMMIAKIGPAEASPGEIITYWLNYTNLGTDWAYNVTVTETYPPGVTFISAIPAPTNGNNVWYMGYLAPGASGSIQVIVQVNAGATGNITNFVQLDYWNSVWPLPPVYAFWLTVIGSGSDTLPPEHLNEQPPINGASFNLTPVISVDVTDISGVNASTIWLYVCGFMIFYDLTAITDGYTVSYWHEGGFTEGQNVSCRIVAKDFVGNALDFTWFFTAATGEAFVIPLHDGWNLLSFPLIPMDTTVENLFSSISGRWDVAKWFDPSDPSDPWKTYRVGFSANDLINIDNTMGFWLHVTDSSGDLVIYGNTPVTTNILLKAGWNLVSYPCQTNKTVATALWGTGADHVEAYDGSSPTLLRELGPGELMESGNGYWVHVPTDSVWTVDS